MFYGEYTHTLDNKGRLIIPSKFRVSIKDEGIEKLYITRGLDECLFMFGDSEWHAQELKFKTMPFTKKEVRNFKRLFFSGAAEVEPDKQWRVLVPDYLRDYAGLGRNIKIVGISDRVEIWDLEKWEAFYNSTKMDYENIAEKLIQEDI